MSALDLAVEQARVALSEGRGTDAMAIVAPFVDDGDKAAWPAHQVFLEGADLAGLRHEAAAVYATLSPTDPYAAAIWTWHEVGTGVAEPRSLADLVAGAPDVVPIALAWLALGNGSPGMAVAFGAPLGTPDGADVAIHGLMADRDVVEAEKWAKKVANNWPDRPDALVGLWSRPANGALGRTRESLADTAFRDALAADDVTQVYRARRLAIAADADAEAIALGEKLVALGEPRPRLARATWGASMRDAAGQTLAAYPLEEWPRMTTPEQRRVARSAAIALEERGRLADAMALLGRIDPDTDVMALRARLAMTADLHEEALGFVAVALGMAALPEGNDAAAADTRSLAGDLAQLHATRGGVYVGQGRFDAAITELAIATALEPAGVWEDARKRVIGKATSVPGDALSVAARLPTLDRDARDAIATALLDQATGDDDAALLAATEAALIGSGELSRRGWARRGALLAARDHDRAAFVSYARAGDDAAARVLWPYTDGALATAADHAAAVLRDTTVAAPATIAGKARLLGQIPDFTVGGDAGEVSSAGLRGQVVVVAFFASWCGPCLQELPALSALAGRLRGEGESVTVLAVGTDEDLRSYQSISRRADLAGITFAWSPDIAARFDVDGIPDTWIVDREGVLRFHHVGYGDGAEARIEREIRSLLR